MLTLTEKQPKIPLVDQSNPWREPRRIWSLWEMLKEFDVRDLMHVVGFLNATFRKEDVAVIRQLLDALQPTCIKLNLRVSLSYLRDLKGADGYKTDDEFLLKEANSLADTISRELGTKHVLAIPDEASIELFQNSRPFDSDDGNVRVNERFPSAITDIQEAANCLALGRSTACVCHLMRVLEFGLAALAAEPMIKVPLATHLEWKDIINTIEGKIKKLQTGGTTPLPEDWRERKAFYSDLATQFRHFKDAWRNNVMHAHDFYDDTKAQIIFMSVREFMRLLATRLSELPATTIAASMGGDT
jgi:hypothetical protein